METLSIFGVVFLLFLVGLEFNIRELKGIRGSILWISLGQLLLTSVLAFSFVLPFVASNTSSLILAIAFVFSSTIIGVKLLSDNKDLNTVHGKIIIGILLAQDLLAIFALIFLAGVNGGFGLLTVLTIVLKFLGLFLFTWAAGVWVTPIGPVLLGVPLFTFLFAGLLFALLLAALIPTPNVDRKFSAPQREARKAERETAVAVDALIWILIVGLIIAIIFSYA